MESHKPLDGAFLTAASPGVVALFQVPLLVRGQFDEEDEVYEDDEDDAEVEDEEVMNGVFLPITISFLTLRLTNTLSLTRNTLRHLSPSLPKSKSIEI